MSDWIFISLEYEFGIFVFDFFADGEKCETIFKGILWLWNIVYSWFHIFLMNFVFLIVQMCAIEAYVVVVDEQVSFRWKEMEDLGSRMYQNEIPKLL